MRVIKESEDVSVSSQTEFFLTFEVKDQGKIFA